MRKYSFRGGVHPLRDTHEGKEQTRNKPIREVAAPQLVRIPMDMHIGAPSEPIVKKGDRVLLGQKIAEAVGGIGIPVHASVSGTVTEVAAYQMMHKKTSLCVSIENDGLDEWVQLAPLGDVETVAADTIIPAVKEAGICGMGGACFPTHIKMSPPAGKTIDTVLLNGAECETFLTADFRLMVEQPERVVNGLRAVMRGMGVSRGVICIEDNKPEAIEAITRVAAGREGVEVATLKTKYPQGGEKQLIFAVLGREVPADGLPMDAGAIVLNVSTAAAIADAIIEGKPLVSRITTVAGAVVNPDNLLLRVGTLLKDAAEACGGYAKEPGKIFVGGSMTGVCAPNDEASLTKANNGMVIFDEKDAQLPEESNCIRCGRCVDACPVWLSPYQMKRDYQLGKLDEMENKWHVMECILCGSCSYVCPARQYLTPAFKDAKDIITARRMKQ